MMEPGRARTRRRQHATNGRTRLTPKRKDIAPPPTPEFFKPLGNNRYWSPYMSVNQCCQYLITSKAYVDFRSSLHVRLVYLKNPRLERAPTRQRRAPAARDRRSSRKIAL